MKEKTAVGTIPSVQCDTVAEQANGVKLLTTLAFTVLGLIVPGGRLYGSMAPFGVSLAAAVDGTGAILVYIAALVGYVLAGEPPIPLRYMAAVAVASAARWVFAVLPQISRKKFFPPLLAGGATLASGLVMGLSDGLLSILLLFAESLAASGFAYFFAESYRYFYRADKRSAMTVSEQTGYILIGAVVLTALSAIEFYYIAPARVLSGVCIMLFARSGKEQGGAVAGTILGISLALVNPERPYIALGFAFGGLLAGLFARYGRFAVAGVYLIGNLLLCLTAVADIAAAAAIYEAVTACVVFCILPRSVDKVLRRFLVVGQYLPAVEGLRRCMTLRLDVAANAMQEVASTVEQVSKKLSHYGAPDLGSMYRYVGDTVCKDCNLKMYCWENNFSAVMDAFNQLTPLLREREAVEKQDLDGFLQRNCRRQAQVAEHVNRGYQLYLQRESAWQRLSEIRAVIADQFVGMGDVLSQLGERFAVEKRVDAETAGRVVSLCEDFGMPVAEAVCLLDSRDRLTVELLAEDVGVCLDGGRWFRELELCCGREFDRPAVLEMQGMVKITVTERPRFRAEIGVAQRTCAGEKLSGDVYEHYVDGDKTVCILSDGMGSGGRAAVDGAMAAGITARLLRAGLQPKTVLKMVNTALLAKSGDESLTTLDVLELDVYTGAVCVYKAGAATSLLKSNGRISRIAPPSMPVGILRDADFEEHRDALKDGDVLVMMSDGMLFDGVAWIEEYLRDSTENATDLAQGLLQAAVSKQRANAHADDMTVAVICMHAIKNEKK